MKEGALRLFVVAAVAAVTVSCSGKSVERIDPDTTVDLSGYWNDTDSRFVSDAMISDVLSATWYTDYMRAHPDKPTVIVGTIRNQTTEHIPVGTFVGDLERAFVNSQKVRVVATAEEREEVRDERMDQGTYASDETIKQFGREHGADYMLIGNVSSIIDEKKGDEVRYYQIDMTLVDIETNEKSWIGQHEIKKLVGRSAYKS